MKSINLPDFGVFKEYDIVFFIRSWILYNLIVWMIEDIIMMFFKGPQNLNNVFFSNYVVEYQQKVWEISLHWTIKLK